MKDRVLIAASREPTGPPLRMPAVPSQHVQSTSAWIRKALSDVPKGGTARVFCGPQGTEIPWLALCAHLKTIEVHGLSPQRLMEIRETAADGASAAQLIASEPDVLGLIDNAIAASATSEPVEAAEGLEPSPTPLAPTDLIVCSGVASQAHIPALATLRHLATARDALDEDPRWHAASLGVAQRCQQALGAVLSNAVAPQGQLVLVVSTAMAHVTQTVDGSWSFPGWYRMLAVDIEALHPGLVVIGEDQWTWVRPHPTPHTPGEVIRIFAVRCNGA